MWWIVPSSGMVNRSSTRAAIRRPATDNFVRTEYLARTSSHSTVYSGVVVAAMIRYCGPRVMLRRRWFPEKPFLRPCSTRVQSAAKGTEFPSWLTNASM